MSDAILQLLAERYTLPEWVLVPQVRDGTGFSASRTADAVAMNCYPSKGLEIHGFEFKIARSDWLRELRDGSKAETVAQHCDRWWIVARDGVVVREELPKSWGLIVAKDDAIRTLVAAPPLPCSNEAGPVDRSFVASFLRGCLERAKKPTDDVLRAARESGRKDERARLAKIEEAAAKSAASDELRWQGAVEKFEAASGVKIDRWDGGRVGEDFAAFLRFHREADRRSLRREADRLRGIADAMTEFAGPEAPAG